MNQQQLEEAYLKSLDDKNRKALEMAKQLLGSTYNLRKSIGFLEWKENNKG
jgi:hypothetical protein|tara:strand:+ start:1243 stop:1395 length:153 start_codon:yes stop_codon:yes gene_type:complete